MTRLDASSHFLFAVTILAAAMPACAAAPTESSPSVPTPEPAPESESEKDARPSPAAVEIIELSGFPCPDCERTAATLEAMRERYGDLLTVRFMHLPPQLPFGARSAARAAEAARRQGRFDDMRRTISACPADLRDETFSAYAEQLGLDPQRYAADLADPSLDKAIRRDWDLAYDLGIQGPPVLFVNGIELHGPQPPEAVSALIDAELAARRAATTAADNWPAERTRLKNDALYRLIYSGAEPVGQAPYPMPTEASVWRLSVDPDRDGVLGPRDALVTVVTFVDYQNPSNRRLATTLDALREKYGDDLRVVVKLSPMSRPDNALLFTLAAVCARAKDQAAFSEMHHALMAIEAPADLTAPAIVDLAAKLGHDRDAFKTCIEDPATERHVAQDIELGTAVFAIHQTDAYINGRRLPGALSFEDFESAIDWSLREARNAFRAKTPLKELYATLVAKGNFYEELGGTTYSFDNTKVPTLGNAGAPVVVTAFLDLECPFSGNTFAAIERIAREDKGRVQFAIQPFPLDMHPNARRFALASLCANEQGRFFDFARALYNAQFPPGELGPRDEEMPAANRLKKVARSIRLDAKRFQRCLDEDTYLPLVDQGVAQGESAAVKATPTVFINGRKWTAWPGDRPNDIMSAIDRHCPEATP